jgi:hypothetical protein
MHSQKTTNIRPKICATTAELDHEFFFFAAIEFSVGG